MSWGLVTMIQLCLIAVPVTIYPFVYAFRPWRSTPAGRALMVKAMGNIILIDMAVLSYFLGDYAGREWIRFMGLNAFLAGVSYLLLVLLRTPRFPQKSAPDPTERRH